MTGSLQSVGPEPQSSDTTLVRALAVLLVTNSHLEHFYPYPWLAGDGLIGNSLFFLLAGYGLVQSERRVIRPFRTWLRRRINRIYPTLIPVVVVFGLLIEGQWHTWGAGDYVRHLIWPTGYTFVQLVMPFYLIFFLFLRARQPSAYVIGMGVATLAYLSAYAFDLQRTPLTGPLHLGQRFVGVHAAAYFQVMLLGGWLAATNGKGAPRIMARPIVLTVLGVAYLATKLAMVKGIGATAYPALHVLTFGVCLSTILVLTRAGAVHSVQRARPVWITAGFLAGLTLEIYLVHSYTAQYEWLWRVMFPVNVVAFWLLTLPLAVAAERVGVRLQRLVGERESGRLRNDTADGSKDGLGLRAQGVGQ